MPASAPGKVVRPTCRLDSPPETHPPVSQSPQQRLTFRMKEARSVAPITACVRLSSDLAVLGFDHPRLLLQRVDDLVQEVTGARVDSVDGIVDPTDSTDRGVDPVNDQ